MFFYVISNPLSTTIVRQLQHVMDANSLTLLLYFYETVNNFAGTTHQIHLVWMSSDGICVHTLMCRLSLSIGRTKSLYQPNLQMNVDRNYRMDGLIEICAHYKSFGFCFQTCFVIHKTCTLKFALPKSMNYLKNKRTYLVNIKIVIIHIWLTFKMRTVFKTDLN